MSSADLVASAGVPARSMQRSGATFARLATALAFIATLTGCGGGGDTAAPAESNCEPGSQVQAGACVAFAERFVERLPTPWSQNGRPLTLELIGYRPQSSPAGRLPAIIFHHGSTGDGRDPSLFKLSFDSQTIARELTARGYLVFFPQRRGRGGSDGLYDEGFTPDRSAYSCVSANALPGLLRAGEDAEVIAQGILARPDVDPARVLVAGWSRGGLLALLHAGQQPSRYRGVVNFVGGWLGEGCADAQSLNRGAFLAATDAPASLWIYGENDPFYSAEHSRAHFDAFVAAGGLASWSLLRRPDTAASGHLIHAEAALWGPLFDSFAARQLP